MTQIQQINADALDDMMHEHGIVATREQIEQLAKDFVLHIEMMQENASYSHRDATPLKCKKCEALEQQLKSANRDINVYQNSVKRRRNAEHVWLDGDTVMFE